MGGLDPYMTDKFLNNAFLSLGEEDVLSISIVKNKFTGEAAGYGLIHFDTDASALMAMHKLNGKIVPNSQPPIRFQLNHSSAQASGNNKFCDREFSIWVTDLPVDCDDDTLLRTFATRFDSIKSAKVLRDSSHAKKPYGFVRFVDQMEQRDALIHMNGFRGMGEKPIKVSMAIPKTKHKEEEAGARGGGKGEYSYYYESYWADANAWANYASYQGKERFIHTARINADNADDVHAPHNDDWLNDEEDEERIIEWDVPVNVDAMNKDFMTNSLEVWDSMEKDRWIYCFDTEDSIIPDFDKDVRTKVVVEEEVVNLMEGGVEEKGEKEGGNMDRWSSEQGEMETWVPEDGGDEEFRKFQESLQEEEVTIEGGGGDEEVVDLMAVAEGMIEEEKEKINEDEVVDLMAEVGEVKEDEDQLEPWEY